MWIKSTEGRRLLKILGIDDNADINDLLNTVLTASGHEYSSVTSGREGVKLIQQNKYDLLLLDIAMPEFSGLDVIEALRKEKLMEKQRIVIVTASAVTEQEIEELLKNGVEKCIRKPLDIDHLVEELEKISTIREA